MLKSKHLESKKGLKAKVYANLGVAIKNEQAKGAVITHVLKGTERNTEEGSV